jgi:hypothetical protein
MRIPHDHAQAAMAEELGHRSKRGEFFNEDNSRLRYLTEDEYNPSQARRRTQLPAARDERTDHPVT